MTEQPFIPGQSEICSRDADIAIFSAYCDTIGRSYENPQSANSDTCIRTSREGTVETDTVSFSEAS